METLKNIIFGIVAIIISVFAFIFLLKLFGLALHLLWNIIFIVLIIIVALPIYVILKKKIFKNFF